MQLLNYFICNDCEMDEYNESTLQNTAHRIIYHSLYTKLNELLMNKNIFKEECDNIYKEALEKYKE